MILQMTNAVQAGLRQQRKLEIISNHLANADTTGFKGENLTFDQMLRANLTIDLTQGDIKMTGNSLDLALAGEGFFKIQTPDGIRYTRDGNFTLNSEGVLVTQNGDAVLAGGAEITIQGTDVTVNQNGEIAVDGETVSRLDIVAFDDPTRLQKKGSSLFVYPGGAAGEIEPETIAVQQGALERSNVTTVVEMTKMIETMRTYEACQKMIQSFDETDAKAINELGKPQ